MPKYMIDMRIDFSGEIEAENEQEAERLAWTNWGDTSDNLITYDGVHDITVSEVYEDEEEDEEDAY